MLRFIEKNEGIVKEMQFQHGFSTCWGWFMGDEKELTAGDDCCGSKRTFVSKNKKLDNYI